MRILIPTLDNNGFDASVSPHFGQSPYLALIDVDDQGNVISINFEKGEGPHEEREDDEKFSGFRKNVHQRIIDLKPDIITVFMIGPRAIHDFASSGIRVFKLPDGVKTISEVFEAINEGRVQEYRMS
ncbi:MAG: NifB/NifX family molybdenum-iron cluster-binding protein [Nitrososphaeria archaeon]